MTSEQERRRGWLVRMLLLARQDPVKVQTWDALVRIAIQYGGRAVEPPTKEEFDSVRGEFEALSGGRR